MSLPNPQKSSRTAMLTPRSCSSVQGWLSGNIGTGAGLATGTQAGAFGYLSTGSSISGNLVASGSLTTSAQGSLSAFLGSGASLDSGIQSSLEFCAKGGLASGLGAESTFALSSWLASSSCSLETSLRGSMVGWLSLVSNSGEFFVLYLSVSDVV